jgi:hypothetical protein
MASGSPEKGARGVQAGLVAGGPVRRHGQPGAAQRQPLTQPIAGPHRWPAGPLALWPCLLGCLCVARRKAIHSRARSTPLRCELPLEPGARSRCSDGAIAQHGQVRQVVVGKMRESASYNGYEMRPRLSWRGAALDQLQLWPFPRLRFGLPRVARDGAVTRGFPRAIFSGHTFSAGASWVQECLPQFPASPRHEFTHACCYPKNR